MAASNQDVFVVRALLAHETNLNQVKQCVEVDFLLHDEGLKQSVLDTADEGAGRRMKVFQLVTARLKADGVPGGTRLDSTSEEHLWDSLLRFKSRFDLPKEGAPWKFTLALSMGASNNFREAIADLVASGGNDRIQIRRPQSFLGPAVAELASTVLGKSKAAKGKGKGKAKGKEGGKSKKGSEGQVQGKGGKGGKGGRGKGKGKAKNQVPPPPEFSVPPGAPESDGVSAESTPVETPKRAARRLRRQGQHRIRLWPPLTTRLQWKN